MHKRQPKEIVIVRPRPDCYDCLVFHEDLAETCRINVFCSSLVACLINPPCDCNSRAAS